VKIVLLVMGAVRLDRVGLVDHRRGRLRSPREQPDATVARVAPPRITTSPTDKIVAQRASEY
jgi:hypothetical protein